MNRDRLLRITPWEVLSPQERMEALALARDAGSESASDVLDGKRPADVHKRSGYLRLPTDDPRRLVYLRTYREAEPVERVERQA